MNYILIASAAAASNTGLANLWEPLLNVLPVFAGAVIGYFFGLLRDANRTKAERMARHQDQVLEAATELLGAATKLQYAAGSVLFKGNAADKASEEFPDGSLDLLDKRENTTRDFLRAFRAFTEAEDLTKPYVLRISILAPHLEEFAKNVITSAAHPEAAAGTENAREIQSIYAEATEDFIAAVRTYLSVPKLHRRSF
ncbi:hypothetical protein [Glutamicibacter arilaitensis]|uniref:hypothetical protein n=1 Tax=Glutamicibacter arilaitensis TaxID=256701 RepID=UPI00384C20E7